ncbi:MarR family transcriptional regulator [Paracoccus salipaludis]|uniref:MarR family transcriptional regulator n=2 Tax=Paracoccus salipaludis TaxID=2032623 RepID=A0A2A2GH05_9RHOB|nr:MarR family transcriptional regulator [Paracoccus salipaludis]
MPGHLIRRLHQLSTQVFAAAMAQAGEDLTPVQFAMMDALAAEPGLDQASLARAIGKDRATVGAVAERLAKKGLIARTASAHDRRAIELELTGAGRDLHARLAPRVAAIQADILPGLSEAERATFVALVARALAAAGD